MLVRKEQRVLELAAFKEKTQSILKTFEIGGRDTKVQEKSNWLDDYIINVSTRNIGVAFPLTHDQDLELPHAGSSDSTAIRAFLFSIKAVEFGTHRGETGQATIRSLSFQFVSRLEYSVLAIIPPAYGLKVSDSLLQVTFPARTIRHRINSYIRK
jgi:hypothetical protein